MKLFDDGAATASIDTRGCTDMIAFHQVHTMKLNTRHGLDMYYETVKKVLINSSRGHY